MNLNHIKNSVK